MHKSGNTNTHVGSDYFIYFLMKAEMKARQYTSVTSGLFRHTTYTVFDTALNSLTRIARLGTTVIRQISHALVYGDITAPDSFNATCF